LAAKAFGLTMTAGAMTPAATVAEDVLRNSRRLLNSVESDLEWLSDDAFGDGLNAVMTFKREFLK
jgi:hypothetical protein